MKRINKIKLRVRRRLTYLRPSLPGPVTKNETTPSPDLATLRDRQFNQISRPVSAGGPIILTLQESSLTNDHLPQPQIPALLNSTRVSPKRYEANPASHSRPPMVSTPDGVSNLITSSSSAISEKVIPQSQHLSSVIPVSPTAKGSEPSLWKQAFDKLSKIDKEAFPFTNTDKREYIEEILEATKKSRDICQEKKLKFKLGVDDIIVRDVADKLLTWFEKFKSIGDCIVQYDPVHAALPWAGVRFLLQIAVNNKETMEVVLIGIERIAKPLVRCAIYERLYLGPGSTLSIYKSLEGALEELYGAILQFLAFAKRYLDKSSTKRMLDGILHVEGKSHFDSITDRESQLLKEVTAAEAEIRRHDHQVLEDRNEKLKVILGEIEKPIRRVDLSVGLMYEEFRGHIQGEKRGKILRWLSQIEYEKHHRNAKERLLENTGQWLLNKKQFREWRSSSASGILWLHGIPGAGKTKLICTVIDVLQSMTPQTYEPVVYFYCNRNESQRRDPTVLMQAIVKQLSIVFPGLPKPVVAEYDKRDQRGLAAGSLGFQESCDLVVLLLDIYPQTTIVIDALDESDPEERGRLLEALKTIIHSSGSLVKILISSRDDIDIKLQLEEVPNLYIEARDNYGDIERFVHREVTEAISKRRLLYGNVTDELKEQVISTIVGKANGMFQWADLQIKHLYKIKFQSDIKEVLEGLPKTLEETYFQILKEIDSDPLRAREVTRKALMWVMCSLKPLNREEWAEFTYWPEPVPKDGVITLFDLCRNLVIWDKQLNHVVFAHLSVQEYLESKTFSSEKANSTAAETCLSVFDDPYALSGVQRAFIPLYGWTFATYSTVYLAEHVELSYSKSMGNKRMVDLLRCFMGTSDKPGEAYCRWQQCADVLLECLGNTYIYTVPTLYYIFPHLMSTPPNPLFAMLYSCFGEELKEQWECDFFDINCKNDRGETLLFVASVRGMEWAVDLLLGKGVDVDAGCSEFARNPVMAAIKGNQGETLVKLIDAGASICSNGCQYTDILEAVVTEGSRGVIEALLARDTTTKITEAVMIGAMRNKFWGKEMIQVLLGRDTSIEITEAVMVAAANNKHSRKKIIQALLARDTSIKITEAVMVAAVGNSFYGEEIVQALLARDKNIEITEAVMIAAAVNSGSGGKIMAILLARDTITKITEAVIVAAARNEFCGGVIMQALLVRDTNIETTETVMIAAANNSISGKDIMAILLARAINIKITEVVMVAAARNELHGGGIIQALLARDSYTKITEAVVVAAANNEHSGKKIIQALLARDTSIEITEAVLATAANGEYWRKEIIQLLRTGGASIEYDETSLDFEPQRSTLSMVTSQPLDYLGMGQPGTFQRGSHSTESPTELANPSVTLIPYKPPPACEE